MKLKELKERFKGLPGTLTPMVPDGNGGYVEVTSVRVEHLEMADFNDEEVLIMDANGSDDA